MTSDKHRLASAIHRAADLLIERDQDEDTVRRSLELVNHAVTELESGTPVSVEQRSQKFISQMWIDPSRDPIADGETFAAFDESPYSGSANALAPTHLEYRRVGQRVEATVILGSALEGRPGRAHGGAVAAVFDDTMGALQLIIGRNGYTRTLETTYLAAFPTSEAVIVVAECTSFDDSSFTVEATATAHERTIATAVGVFTEIAANRWTKT